MIICGMVSMWKKGTIVELVSGDMRCRLEDSPAKTNGNEETSDETWGTKD